MDSQQKDVNTALFGMLVWSSEEFAEVTTGIVAPAQPHRRRRVPSALWGVHCLAVNQLLLQRAQCLSGRPPAPKCRSPLLHAAAVVQLLRNSRN
ncbi:hypothetical protein EVAR_12905_1 [Eumeta japonica]|uniref:Uncharacterized protein n=1 Tax=Eumeta variegata TaxID=151549 RepID=A0A4C1TW62_EUMVA|nr:hypothetical protein EVAR_12905_1 [Eumeta japonica]